MSKTKKKLFLFSFLFLGIFLFGALLFVSFSTKNILGFGEETYPEGWVPVDWVQCNGASCSDGCESRCSNNCEGDYECGCSCIDDVVASQTPDGCTSSCGNGFSVCGCGDGSSSCCSQGEEPEGNPPPGEPGCEHVRSVVNLSAPANGSLVKGDVTFEWNVPAWGVDCDEEANRFEVWLKKDTSPDYFRACYISLGDTTPASGSCTYPWDTNLDDEDDYLLAGHTYDWYVYAYNGPVTNIATNWSFDTGGTISGNVYKDNDFVSCPGAQNIPLVDGSWQVYCRGGSIGSTWVEAFYGPLSTPTPSSVPTPTPTPTPTPIPGSSVIFFDDFETDNGWIINPGGSDTATTGQWERGNPEETDWYYMGYIFQLGDTVSGVNDLVTGKLGGWDIGIDDIDNGFTTIRSPAIDLPESDDITLSFSYYLAHLDNATTEDYLRVKVGSTTVFEKLGAVSEEVAVWVTSPPINISNFSGQTINIQIEAADMAVPSLIEAAIDDVEITAVLLVPTPTPTPTPTPSPTPTPTPEPTDDNMFTCQDSLGNIGLAMDNYFVTVVPPLGWSDTVYYCSDNSPSVTLTTLLPNVVKDIYLVDYASTWWQVEGGDIHTEGSEIVSDIPLTSPLEYLMIDRLDGLGGLLSEHGVVSQFEGGSLDVGEGGVADTGSWYAKSGVYSGKKYGYVFWKNHLSDDFEEEEWDGSSGGIFETNSNLIIGDPDSLNVSAGVFILVDGNVIINNNVIVEPNSSLVIVASGNIAIDSSVSILQGYYIADGIISTGSGDEQLTVEGGLIGYTDILLERDFGDNRNNTQPAEKFIFRPDIYMNLDEALKVKRIEEWKEIAP